MIDIKSPIIVTGAAGFIGAALSKKLLESGLKVIGVDNLNNYYNPVLKEHRLNLIKDLKGWKFYKVCLEDKENIEEIFKKYKPKVIVNLAAQAGVRYSLENPESYIQSNIVGFLNIVENCRKFEVENFIYASSSSVYGGNKNLPFNEDQQVDHPISLYAATKKSNELIAHSYSSIFKIPSTGLRFFTVYGPWGRPDMSPMIFTKSILQNKPIEIFNYGKMRRDFTFVDDIVEGIFRCCFKPATIDESFNFQIPNSSTSFAPHRIFNIGNSSSVELMKFINILEDQIGVKAIKTFTEIQKGDVIATEADTSKFAKWVDFKPQTKLENGIGIFVKWYKDYYKIN